MTEVAVVGIGGWGKNLARNYFELAEANLRYVCDLDADKLERAKVLYPGVITTNKFDDLLADRAGDRGETARRAGDRPARAPTTATPNSNSAVAHAPAAGTSAAASPAA